MSEQRKTTSNELVESQQTKPTNTDIVSSNSDLINDQIDTYLEVRKEWIDKVVKKMVEGKDFHVIQKRKSLAKGGAEKIAAIFGWQADFKKDEDVLGAFNLEGLIAFKCTLSKANNFVGEGRGAATLSKNNSDPNKTIKMAQKSAFIDAVLRSSGLSDLFSQDLEDLDPKTIQDTTSSNSPHSGQNLSNKSITVKQANFIKGLRSKKGELPLSDDELRKMTAQQASDEIERLQKPEEIATIEIEEVDLLKPGEDVNDWNQKMRDLQRAVREQPNIPNHEND